MKRLFSVVFAVVSFSGSFAQQVKDKAAYPERTGGINRQDYIKSFPDHFFIWPVLKQRKLDFEMKNISGPKQTLSYKSNKPYSLGIGMYLFEMGFELAFAVPLDEQSKRIYGESKARDVQFNVLGKKWGIDAYLQKYDGFYVVDSELNVPSNTPFPQRPDIGTRNIGTSVNYTFNNKKFSFRSAYNFSETQLRSAGSFLLFGSLSNFKISGDSSIISIAHVERFGDRSHIRKISSTVFGVIPGYTYSLIYKGFFLNGTLGFGPTHLWLNYEHEDGNEDQNTKFSVLLTARIAMGYNGDRVFGGLSFTSQGGNARFENIEMNNSNSSFKILLGYRFREWGILTEKVSDLPRKFL